MGTLGFAVGDLVVVVAAFVVVVVAPELLGIPKIHSH
jgi:hypothetical protein